MKKLPNERPESEKPERDRTVMGLYRSRAEPKLRFVYLLNDKWFDDYDDLEQAPPLGWCYPEDLLIEVPEPVVKESFTTEGEKA